MQPPALRPVNHRGTQFNIVAAAPSTAAGPRIDHQGC
jgi:hypothetical protein